MRRRTLWAPALYTLLAILLTWPLAAHFATHTTGDGIDDPALAWNLWWVKARLVDQLNLDLFHSGWMFHPVDINLAFYTLTPLNGLLSIPLQTALSLTIANNLLLLSSFVLGGFGTYLLVRQMLQIWLGAGMRFGEERNRVSQRNSVSAVAFWAALAAGGLYAFASAKLFYAALGQFNIAGSQWIPFCALYLVRLAVARTRRERLVAAAWAGVFLVLQAWTELTYASFLLIFVALYALWLLLVGPDAGVRWRARLRSVLPLLLTGASFAVGLLPILLAMAPDLAAEGDFFASGGGFADVFSADLLGYLLPTRLHPLFGSFAAALPFPNDKGQQIYLGYTAAALALMGVVALWRGEGMRSAQTPSYFGETRCLSPADLDSLRSCPLRRWFWLWVPLLLIFWLLTLGPQLRWAGTPITLGGHELPGPFALVSRLPFFSGNRYPSRYSVMLLLAAAVLVGAGLNALLTRLAGMRRGRGAVAAALALAAALLLFEHLSVPLPLSDQRIPPVFARVAAPTRSDTGVLLELPTGWRNGARVLGKSDLLIMAQQWWQTEHGLRRLGGNTSRNPEFKFQYFTDAPLLGDLIALFNADQPHVTPVIDAQLDAMIERNRPLAAQVLDFLGVEYVAVYVEQSPPQLLRFVEEALPLTLLAEESSPAAGQEVQTIRLYRVDLPPAPEAAVIEMSGPLANLALAEGWSPAAGEPVRYAVRQSPRLLLDLPTAGARVLLEWAAPIMGLQAAVNGQAAAAVRLDDAGLRWAIDVPAGAADQPVDEVALRLAGQGLPAAELAAQTPGDRAVGSTGVRLPDDVSLLVRSAGEEVGDFAHIWLDGVDVASGERGYNLAALSAEGELLGTATFDTLAAAQASADMAAWIDQWPAGTVIAGAVADEASYQLGQAAVDALRGLGVLTDLRDHFRWSHAFVGVAGAEPGTALDAAGLLQPAQVQVGPALNGPRVYGQLGAITIEPN